MIANFAKLLIPFLVLTLFSAFSTAADQNKTRIGPTYKIVEPDMLEQMLAKLQKMQDSGEALKLQKEAAKRTRTKLLNPAPVAGITKATSNKVYFYDPTVVANQDITGPDGRILIPRGTKVNPLDIQDFGDPMLFFDARDEKQVKNAITILTKYKGAVMPVLTGGSFFDLMKKWKRQVYYDQTGFITRKLGVKHVPALVTQEGNLLRIEEFAL